MFFLCNPLDCLDIKTDGDTFAVLGDDSSTGKMVSVNTNDVGFLPFTAGKEENTGNKHTTDNYHSDQYGEEGIFCIAQIFCLIGIYVFVLRDLFL